MVYQKRTLRKTQDPDLRSLMKASNTIESGLRALRAEIEGKRALAHARNAEIAGVQADMGELDELFGQDAAEVRHA